MGTFIDLTGMKFGYLEVVCRYGIAKGNGNVLWLCRCICGNEKPISGTTLRKGAKTCGCKYVDYAGLRSGNLVAYKYICSENSNAKWLCKCDCGGTKEVYATMLKSKRVTSCGCKKGNHSHGLAHTRIYNIWNAMKQRCANKNFKDYAIYGGRGINYCEKWETFEGFMEDMYQSYLIHLELHGSKNTTLDRIDSNLGYNLSNCRWATIEQQSYNKRDTIFIEYDGVKYTIRELSSKYNLPTSTLYGRYERGEIGLDLIRPYGQKRYKIK